MFLTPQVGKWGAEEKKWEDEMEGLGRGIVERRGWNVKELK